MSVVYFNADRLSNVNNGSRAEENIYFPPHFILSPAELALSPGPPSFSMLHAATLKSWEGPGDEAKLNYKSSYSAKFWRCNAPVNIMPHYDCTGMGGGR